MLRGLSGAARRFVSTSNALTKYTTLSNGVTVAFEHNPHAELAAVGVYFAAGSRAEGPYNNGVAALAASVLGHGCAGGVLMLLELLKEVNAVVAQSTNGNVAHAAEAVAKAVLNYQAGVSDQALGAAKAAQLARVHALENSPSKMLVEHLNASAFQGYSLGLPTYGTPESIADIESLDVLRLLDAHLVASNTVVAALGNFDHATLVEALEKHLLIREDVKPTVAPAVFLGSEVRMRDDTMPKAYVSIAAQGEGLSSPAYHVAKVALAIFGSFDHNAAIAKFTSPKLASIVQDYHIVDKYSHFSTSYSDTGLWGFQAEISNLFQIDDFVHFTLKEWNRLSISISDAEVARGKAAVKAALLASLDSPAAIASEIANKVLLQGYKASIAQDLAAIDAVSTKDVKAWASAALWDQDIVIAGTGAIEGLLDYNRSRNDMAMLRF